jgi:thiol-disulfide isomerase/thioredoxin
MMRRLIVVIWLCICLTVGCGGPSASTSGTPAPAAPAATPEAARNFTLQALDGESVSLDELRGKWVLINFWATWCLPCVEEMPYLNQVAATRDKAVLGVNFKESADQAAAFAADHGIQFPILLAPDEITLLVYGVRGLPRTIVVAPDGTIAGRFAGALDPVKFERWLDDQGVPRQ